MYEFMAARSPPSPDPAPARRAGQRLTVSLLVLAAFGGSFSLYLTYIHLQLHREPGWQSVCSITARVSCDAVVLSPYGTVLGLPLSILGAWFYCVVLALGVAGLRASGRFPRSPAVIVLVSAAMATVVSVVLAVVSAFVVGSFCLFCAGLYATNGVLLAVAWRAVRSTGETIRDALCWEGRQWQNHSWRAFLVSASALTLLFVLGVVYARGTAGGSEVCRVIALLMRAGTSNDVELKVYSDFQCPHCYALDQRLRQLRDARHIRIIQRHYPLDRACNPKVKYSTHQGACRQARAALCAEKQGYGAEFGNRVFDADARSVAEIKEVARELRMDAEELERCVENDDTYDRLRASIAEAEAAGVRATPTLFTNGRKLVGGLSAEDMSCLKAAR